MHTVTVGDLVASEQWQIGELREGPSRVLFLLSCADPSDACLLGVPLGCLDFVSAVLNEKVTRGYVEDVGIPLCSRCCVDPAVQLVCICKLLYTLQTVPCFLLLVLGSYDEICQSTASSILNIDTPKIILLV